ncbi:MAG: hypothetical protein NTV86_09295 [Planctomycetota bacterium]|nr:hypothetical protein [Planctomycetota bacterium]
MPTSRNALICLAALAASLAGCHKDLIVTQAPPFWPPSVRTVAVLPFRNATPVPEASLAVSDAFAAALARLGTCHVLTRADFRDVADDVKLQQWVQEDSPALAAHLRGANRAQAYIVGSVALYATTTVAQDTRVPLYADAPEGRRVVGYKNAPLMTYKGEAALTVQMIDADGRVLYSVHAPVHRAVSSAGSPPPMDAAACRAKALEEAVGVILAQFAPMPRLVELKNAEAFYVAGEHPGKEWKRTSKYTLADRDVAVVLRLPPSCEGNTFQVVITRKASHNVAQHDVASQVIVWRTEDSARGLTLKFPIADVVRAGDGPGQYLASLVSSGQPVIRCEFKISAKGQ